MTAIQIQEVGYLQKKDCFTVILSGRRAGKQRSQALLEIPRRWIDWGHFDIFFGDYLTDEYFFGRSVYPPYEIYAMSQKILAAVETKYLEMGRAAT